MLRRQESIWAFLGLPRVSRRSKIEKLVLTEKMTKMTHQSVSVVSFAIYFTVQRNQTRNKGTPKPKLDYVFCQGIPFYGTISMSARPTHKNDIKTIHHCSFCQVYGTKQNKVIRAHQIKPKLGAVFCQRYTVFFLKTMAV